MTNHWEDIKNADLVLIMGGNAAEAHPVGFKWVIEAKQRVESPALITRPPAHRRESDRPDLNRQDEASQWSW